MPATSEQEEFEFRRRAEQERAAQAQAGPQERSLLGAVGEGALKLIPHAVDAWHAATVDLPNTLIDPNKRQVAGQALGKMLSDAVDTGKGYVQQVRDLSPPAYRGSAPTMNTAPADAMERDVVNKYGVNVAPQRLSAALSGDLGQPNLNAYRTLKDTIAEHPLAVAATVAPGAGKALERAGALAAKVPQPAVLARALEVANAGKASRAAIGEVRDRALGAAETRAAAAARDAGDATKSAAARAKAAALADALRADAETKAAAAAKAAGENGPIGVGQVSHNTDLGGPAQKAVVNARGAIESDMRAQDEQLRGARDALVSDVESKGISLADLPEAKAALSEAEQAIRPNPGTSPTVTTVPTPEETKLHQMVVGALKDRKVVLTPEEAATAKDLGYDVDVVKQPGGGQQFVRTFKTSFEAVDNLRRRMGEAFGGKEAEGFAGIPRALMERKYAQLQEIENAFTGNAHQAVQDSWKAAKEKLAPYDETKFGHSLSGDQRPTDIPNLPASRVPQAIVGGGRGTYEQFAALSGNPGAAAQVARDIVEREFRDPVTDRSYDFDTIAKKVRPGTQLGDMIAGIPDLKASVEQHLTRLRDAKMAGVDAERFGATAKEHADTAKAAQSEEKAFAGTAAELKAEATKYGAEFVKLKNLPDKDVVSHARSLIDQMAAKGLIDSTEQEAFYKLANGAESAADKKRLRDKIVAAGAGAVGLGVASKLGLPFLAHTGQQP